MGWGGWGAGGLGGYDLYVDGNMEERSELGKTDRNKRQKGVPRDRKPGVYTATDIMGEEISAAQKAGWQAGKQRRQV